MNSSEIHHSRVVILGGGYAAIHAYRSLVRKLCENIERKEVEITVVCPLHSHVFHGWTAEVLEGIIPSAHRLSSLNAIFKKAKILYGEAIFVDIEARCVKIKTNNKKKTLNMLSYDHLLIATGSRDHTERIPGMSQFGWTLKSQEDVVALRHHIGTVLIQAETTSDASLRARLLTFVIAGGGFTGAEVCAAIAEMLRRERQNYHCLMNQPPTIILIHSGSTLLPQVQAEKISNYTHRQLIEYGVDLRFETRVTTLDATGAHLSNGEILHAATIVSTIGQTIIPLAGTENLLRSNDGRLITDLTLRVHGTANIWAGGDAASVHRPNSTSICPANALWAIFHGKLIGKNIARAIRKKNLHSFKFSGLGQAASLGIGKGFGDLFGVQLTGWLPWIMRILFFLCFMPSRAQAFRVALDWLLLPLRNRWLSPLNSTEEPVSKRSTILPQKHTILYSYKAYGTGF